MSGGCGCEKCFNEQYKLCRFLSQKLLYSLSFYSDKHFINLIITSKVKNNGGFATFSHQRRNFYLSFILGRVIFVEQSICNSILTIFCCCCCFSFRQHFDLLLWLAHAMADIEMIECFSVCVCVCASFFHSIVRLSNSIPTYDFTVN